MKSVLISIQPYWVFLIIAKAMGWKVDKEKTIEVRKNLPKDANWDKSVKVYCSKDKRSFSKIPKEYQPFMEQFLGKVSGEFVCDKIEHIEIRHFTVFGHENRYTAVGENPDYQWLKKSCLSYDEAAGYGKNAPLYGWHISDLKIYDKPKELREFNFPHYRECDIECRKCKFSIPVKSILGVEYDCDRSVKRPPQSWCYVKEVKL